MFWYGFVLIFFSKINIYYKKYGVIIYDFSWKVWAPFLEMSYQKLYHSLTWINANPLENKNRNPPTPPPPHLYPNHHAPDVFSIFPISFT